MAPPQGRNAGALVMALEGSDGAASLPTLNETLHETERMMDPQLRATGPFPEPGQVVTPAAYQRTITAVRDALFGHIQRRPINPSLAAVRPSSAADIVHTRRPNPRSTPPSDELIAHRRRVDRILDEADRARAREMPAPAPLPAQYVRLAHVPRDPSQSPMNGATAMMRTWVLVDDEDLVPPPPLPALLGLKDEPRPPLAQPVCCICMDEKLPCEVVFTGCGHMNTCLRCSQVLLKEYASASAPCPLCRTKSRPLLVRVG